MIKGKKTNYSKMINLKRKEKRREKSLLSQNVCLNLLIAEPDPAFSRIFFLYMHSTLSNLNPNLLEERKGNGWDDVMMPLLRLKWPYL